MIRLKIAKAFRGASVNFKLNAAIDIGAERSAVFFGPSGAGKTLTMQCIAGLARPDAGFIEVCGEMYFDKSARIDLAPQKRHIGYMLQDYALFPNLDVIQNVAWARSRFFGKILQKKVKEDARAMLARVGLENLRRNYPGELSGGQKQRVALARALFSKPRLFCLTSRFPPLILFYVKKCAGKFWVCLTILPYRPL